MAHHQTRFNAVMHRRQTSRRSRQLGISSSADVAARNGGSTTRTGERCELVITLFRRPEMSDEKFAADAAWVMRDLQAAKRILERREEK